MKKTTGTVVNAKMQHEDNKRRGTWQHSVKDNMTHKTKLVETDVGTVVLMKGEDKTRGKWKIGIVELYRGNNQETWKVQIKMGKGCLEQPVNSCTPSNFTAIKWHQMALFQVLKKYQVTTVFKVNLTNWTSMSQSFDQRKQLQHLIWWRWMVEKLQHLIWWRWTIWKQMRQMTKKRHLTFIKWGEYIVIYLQVLETRDKWGRPKNAQDKRGTT